MCIRATKQDTNGLDVPLNFIGDGKYHNYTIVWHTGGLVTNKFKSGSQRRRYNTNGQDGYVDFYIDGYYLGTNNVFVPTRGSRFFIAHWYPSSKNHLWNG